VLSQYLRNLGICEPTRSKIVYTTLFGKSDSLKQPACSLPNWDLICVTNQRNISFGAWRPVFVEAIHRDPRRTARVFKILPWNLFPDAEESLFLDASIKIIGPVDEFVERYCNKADLSCFVHPVRDCAYAEAQACIEKGNDDPNTINWQMHAYRRGGFPPSSGLIASAVLHRRHTSDKVRHLMESWANEVELHSVRDQLSFNYSSWATGVGYNPIPLDIFDNQYFEVQPHVRLQRFDENGKDVSRISEKAFHYIISIKSRIIRAIRRLRRIAKLLRDIKNPRQT